MEGHFSTGQSPQWAVVPMEEEEVKFLNIVRKDTGHFTARKQFPRI